MDIAFGNRLGEMVTEKESSLSEAKKCQSLIYTSKRSYPIRN